MGRGFLDDKGDVERHRVLGGRTRRVDCSADFDHAERLDVGQRFRGAAENPVDRILDRAADRSGLATGLNGSSGSEEPVGVGGEASLEELEAAHIKRVLERCKTMKEAADTLGINKATLYRKRLKLNLD